jgi:8-oxo-dGTP pyrophosphatase MutT (NUDIX family)
VVGNQFVNKNHRRLPHHFTASGIVVCRDHILLVNHKRIGAWVPPGGHVEPEEMPEETVVREILEETGVAVEVLSEPVPDTGDSEAFFLATPFYVQSVLAIEGGQEFYHLDLAYLCRPAAANQLDARGLPVLNGNQEVKEARWIERASAGRLILAKNVQQALDTLENVGVVSRFSRVAPTAAFLDNPGA